jgi:hypothetical protein
METELKNLMDRVSKRKLTIRDISLEDDGYNKLYLELCTLENSLIRVIKAIRDIDNDLEK